MEVESRENGREGERERTRVYCRKNAEARIIVNTDWIGHGMSIGSWMGIHSTTHIGSNGKLIVGVLVTEAQRLRMIACVQAAYAMHVFNSAEWFNHTAFRDQMHEWIVTLFNIVHQQGTYKEWLCAIIYGNIWEFLICEYRNWIYVMVDCRA